jgi:RNA polymerase-binding transcription factor DksA
MAKNHRKRRRQMAKTNLAVAEAPAEDNLGDLTIELANIVRNVMDIYEVKRASLNRSGELLDYKRDVTIARIKIGRHAQCDCGQIISEESLQTLEIFCADCLQEQGVQALMLQGKIAELRKELASITGSTLHDMRTYSRKTVSNHEAEHSNSNLNPNAVVRMPGLNNRIKALDSALERVPFGKYGICEDCECVIPLGRLKLEPHTKYCTPCKSEYPTNKVKVILFTH